MGHRSKASQALHNKKVAAKQAKVEQERLAVEAKQTEIADQEFLPTEAEQAKIAEQERLDAEAKQAKAEQDRLDAEAKQVKAEQDRLDAEAKQAKAEQDRLDTEAKQAKAEQDHLDTEAKQAKIEQERLAAEGRAIEEREGLRELQVSLALSMHNDNQEKLVAMATQEKELLKRSMTHNKNMELFGNKQYKLNKLEPIGKQKKIEQEIYGSVKDDLTISATATFETVNTKIVPTIKIKLIPDDNIKIVNEAKGLVKQRCLELIKRSIQTAEGSKTGLTTSITSKTIELTEDEFRFDYEEIFKADIIDGDSILFSYENELLRSARDIGKKVDKSSFDYEEVFEEDIRDNILLNDEHELLRIVNKEGNNEKQTDKKADAIPDSIRPQFSIQNMHLCIKGINIAVDLTKVYCQPNNIVHKIHLSYDLIMLYSKFSHYNNVKLIIPFVSLASTIYVASQGEYIEVGINIINAFSHYLLTSNILSSYSESVFLGLNVMPIGYDLYKGEYLSASVQTLGVVGMFFAPSSVGIIYAIYYTGRNLYSLNQLYQENQQEDYLMPFEHGLEEVQLSGVDTCNQQ